jgi:hypothetical protein
LKLSSPVEAGALLVEGVDRQSRSTLVDPGAALEVEDLRLASFHRKAEQRGVKVKNQRR